MLNILYYFILKVILCSHMKKVCYIATFVYIHTYIVRNNFIITEWLNMSPRIYLTAFIGWECVLSSALSH